METTSGSSSMDWGALIASLKLETVLSVLLTLVICLVAMRLIRILLQKVLQKTTLEQRIQKYVLGALRAVMWIVTVLIVADQLGIPITSLVALLSVLSLGVSLAVQTVLSNVAGGLVILSSHPFSIGDFIEVSGVSGTVQEITLNHTKVMTPDGLLVMLPNKELSGSKVINYTVLGRRRVTQKVTAAYNAPTETVKEACRQALSMTDKLLEDPASAVYLSNYGASSIEYTIFCWCNAADYWDVYFSLGENLRTSFAKKGVEMTYDHLNVHIVENKG